MRHLIAAVTGLAVLLLTSSAQAATAPAPVPEDNGRWVGPIAFLVVIAVAGGMLFIVNAYRKSGQDDHR